jgi:hypothetical protein
MATAPSRSVCRIEELVQKALDVSGTAPRELDDFAGEEARAEDLDAFSHLHHLDDEGGSDVSSAATWQKQSALQLLVGVSVIRRIQDAEAGQTDDMDTAGHEAKDRAWSALRRGDLDAATSAAYELLALANETPTNDWNHDHH